MIEGFWLWLAFALLSATTFLTRGSFIMAGEKGRLPPALQRALRGIATAAMDVSDGLVGDHALYSRIFQRVADGESYYAAAAAEHRANHYQGRYTHRALLRDTAPRPAVIQPWYPAPTAMQSPAT